MVPKFNYDHGSQISVVRAHEIEPLVAIGGANSVEVLIVSQDSFSSIASFHIGCRVTAIAWGNSTSVLSTDNWSIHLAIATTDLSLHLLTKSHNGLEKVFTFGAGLTGHRAKINDIVFCGGRGSDAWRYLATVSEDKTLMVWDLHPSYEATQPPPHGVQTIDIDTAPLPTAYVVPFKHPLVSVCAHGSSSKEVLISDCRGSIYLTDWRTDFSDQASDTWHRPNVIELVEPNAMATSMTGISTVTSGSLAWRRDNPDIIGAVFGPKFALWDLSKLFGGKPAVTCRTFPQGAGRFRWCPSHPEYFAISAGPTSTSGAVVNIHSTSYPSVHSNVLELAPRPHTVQDFDFVPSSGPPRIAAGVGQSIAFVDVNWE